ncbi:MAG: gliding motility-associated C-terminal domain-containing protein [Saprospiraceae bacterium]|nr:gliding motility-associated C-terminal domain-containing protein [Saprospiraceae bacterium]
MRNPLVRFCSLLGFLFFSFTAHTQKCWISFEQSNDRTSTAYFDFESCTASRVGLSDAYHYSLTIVNNTPWFYFRRDFNPPWYGWFWSVFVYTPIIHTDTVLVGSGPVFAPSPNDTILNAMTCDYFGLIYAAGQGITLFNPADSSMDYRGALPPGLASAGGITYRNGEVFLSTVSNSLALVDVDNPGNTVEVAQFPPGTPPIDALVSFPYRCDSIVTFAFGRRDSSSIIYSLDFSDYSLSEICTFDKAITAAAAREECILPPCSFTLDLDAQDLSGLPGQDFRADTACFGPLPIAAPLTAVWAGVPLDSIRIRLIGILDAGQEYLELAAAPNLAVFGSGTPVLTLVDTGSATFADFESALAAVRYRNDAVLPTHGVREARAQAFAWMYRSTTSTAYLPIGNAAIRAEATAIDTVSCFGFSDGALSIAGRGGTGPYTFQWAGGQQDATLSGLPAGAYPLTVTDATGCANSDTLYLPQPDSLQLALQAPIAFVCGNTGSVAAIVSGGTPPYSYGWSTGGADSLLTGIPAGAYSLALSDARGCTASASISLDGAPQVAVTQTESLCRGETFVFEGAVYTTDTLLCRTYFTTAGCDSLHCIALDFRDTFRIAEIQQICFGDSYDFYGTTLTTDTTLCRVFTASNGCDSTRCLTLEVIRRESVTSAAICPEGSYSFHGQTLTQAGTYTAVIPLPPGCDSTAVLQLSLLPAPTPGLSASGSLCDGGAVVLAAAPGLSAYLWSDGSTAPALTTAVPGWYYLTVTDAQGCTATDSIGIADEAVRGQFSVQTPPCEGLPGQVFLDQAQGGTPPYRIGLSGDALQPADVPLALPEGVFLLRIEDSTGCGTTEEVTVPASPQWLLELGRDTSIRLGQAVRLQPQGLWPQSAQFSWQPPQGLDCDTCAVVRAMPPRSTRYELILRIAPGCELRDALTILVDGRAPVYVPNAFSPNGDGINDWLAVFAGDGVATVRSFRVFDRWGAAVFERLNFSPNVESLGWDGAVRGRPANAGLYIYTIEWERADGQTERASGEAMLMR